jgi:hypothetical protein
MPNDKDSYIVVLPILDGQEDEGMYTVRNYILITDEKGNIKNKYYGEYTFHYWMWKNYLDRIPDNNWIGFCGNFC